MLEVVFRIFKETSNIKGFEIFQKKFIYNAYADDTTIFLKNTESVINLLEIFKHFSQFPSLEPSKSKCETAGTGVLKRVKVALCGMRYVNLYENTIKKLGFNYSLFIIHLNNLKMTRISKSTLQKLRLCYNCGEQGTCHLKGKLPHLVLVKTIQPSIIDQLNKTQKNFIWNGLNPKIKNSTFNNNYGK